MTDNIPPNAPEGTFVTRPGVRFVRHIISPDRKEWKVDARLASQSPSGRIEPRDLANHAARAWTVNLGVKGMSINTPPTSPAPSDLDAYVIGGAPTGDWAGHAGELTWWNDSGNMWEFVDPITGDTVYDPASKALWCYDVATTPNWTNQSPQNILSARLGANALLITDWNTALEDGWYRTAPSSSSHAPDTTSAWCGHVEAIDSSNLSQYCTKFIGDLSSLTTTTYRRDRAAGNWGSWYRIDLSLDELNALYQITPGSISADKLDDLHGLVALQARSIVNAIVADNVTGGALKTLRDALGIGETGRFVARVVAYAIMNVGAGTTVATPTTPYDLFHYIRTTAVNSQGFGCDTMNNDGIYGDQATGGTLCIINRQMTMNSFTWDHITLAGSFNITFDQPMDDNDYIIAPVNPEPDRPMYTISGKSTAGFTISWANPITNPPDSIRIFVKS